MNVKELNELRSVGGISLSDSTLERTYVEHQTIELICFTLEGQEFGIPIHHVMEIIQPPPITTVVHTPDLVAGVINIRGVIIAVLNIKQLLQVNETESIEDSKVVHVNCQEKTAGILVDTVEVVKEVTINDIYQLDNNGDTSVNYFDGVVQLEDHPLTILSVSKILNAPDLAPFYNE